METTTFFFTDTEKASLHLRKRAFDICFSLAVLILFSPLFFLIWLAIHLSSSGKALYAQERAGHRGKVFKCYKFRTMIEGAEHSLPLLLAFHPDLRLEWKRNRKLRSDPRVFPLGRFLRKTSLDEFPQFWNVLKGDLSVVGPRPYMIEQVKDLGVSANKILSIRPGITGLWQTSGRSSTSFQKRISLDIQYVERESLWLDMGLIIRTIPALFLTKDAY